MYEIVKVGDAYATPSQRIRNKKSFSRMCQEEPDRTEEIARILCEKGKELFSIPCNTDNFVKALDRIDREYGSLDAYLKGPIGLTDDDIRVLMERYLE